MTQLIKQSWTSYPNTFFSGMPLLTYQQVRRNHVQVLLLWNKRKSLQDPAFHCIITRGPLCPVSCTLYYKKIDVALETASQKPVF
jgi:hypothetical protein